MLRVREYEVNSLSLFLSTGTIIYLPRWSTSTQRKKEWKKAKKIVGRDKYLVASIRCSVTIVIIDIFLQPRVTS